MNDFRMTPYWNQYREAVVKMDRLRQKAESLKEIPPFLTEEEFQDMSRGRDEAQAEYEAFKIEVDSLWYLAQTGRNRAEYAQEEIPQWKKQFGGFNAHWPGQGG